MKLKLLLSLFFLLLIGACRHKEDKPQMIYVDPLLKQHFAFKPGSYWIYKDSVSGKIDSAYVWLLDSMMQNFNNYTLIGQIIQSHIVQVSLSGSISDSLRTLIELRGQNQMRIYTTPGIGANDFGGKNIPLHYPFEQGQSWQNDFGKIIEVIPNYTLAGQNYRNVAVCYQNIYSVVGQDAWLYINDSVGFIQMDIYSDNTISRKWELQRCRIIK